MKKMNFAKTSIITSALIAGNLGYSNAQVNKEYARMQPIVESKMEVLPQVKKNFFSEGISTEYIRENGKSFKIPVPLSAPAAIVDDGRNTDPYSKYAIREIKLNETIKYYNFKITLYHVSYTFKEISAMFIVTAKEEEWKVKTSLKKREKFDYIDHHNESAWRLNLVVDKIESPSKVIIKLMQEKIRREEVNKDSE